MWSYDMSPVKKSTTLMKPQEQQVAHLPTRGPVICAPISGSPAATHTNSDFERHRSCLALPTTPPSLARSKHFSDEIELARIYVDSKA